MNNVSISNANLLKKYLLLLLFLPIGISFNSCAPKLAPFDSEAFESGKRVVTKALGLIGLATKPYAENESVVNAFMNSYNQQLDLEKSRGESNLKTVQMWELLMDPSQNLLGGFIEKWKTDGSLSQVFVDQAKREIGSNLDKIIKLEGKKKKL